jgi:hypothetical protein
VERLWNKQSTRKELTPSMEAPIIIEWDNNEASKHTSRRLSMEQYVQEALGEWTPNTMQEPRWLGSK